jgi:EF-P beta-lysylation protein EpmB
MEILTTNPEFVLAESEAHKNLSLSDSISNASWQEVLKKSIRNLPDLLEKLNLSTKIGTDPRFSAIQAVETFPVFVPLPYLSRIRVGDPGDPLLAQVLPRLEEDLPAVGFTKDPLMEAEAKRGAGLLQKYSGRVLMIVTGSCAIHCRYCFRRHFPYAESPKSISQWAATLDEIAADPSIEEVILSGGDPLMAVDETLGQLVERLDSIPHLSRLRIHTRLPIMIPQRVTDLLLRTLGQTRLRTVVVIHCNHANELDEEVASSLGRLAKAGALLLNQSVLLRGVNDDVDSLRALSLRLLACAVLPYYLHKNDPIAGTSHFEVSAERGIALIKRLQEMLPGYAVPKFVQEIAGEPSKVPLS